MHSWRLALALAAASALAGAAGAAEPGRPPGGVLDFIRDMRMTLQARRSIRLDKDLNKLNLGVEVKNGIAHVWGPVPDSHAARRAVSRLEAIDGVTDVRTDFHIRKVAPPDAFASRKVDLPQPQPPAGSGGIPPPVPKAESPGVPRSPPLREEKPAMTPVRRAGPTLAERIAAIRKSDPRFADVAIAVSGADVTVFRGNDDDAASLFAQRLNDVQGIGDVILANK